MALTMFNTNIQELSLLQSSWASTIEPSLKKSASIGNLLKGSRDSAATLTTTNTVYNLCSVVVPKGVWLLWAFVSFPSVPVNTTQEIAMISLSATTQTGTEYDGSTGHVNLGSGSSVTVSVGPYPISILETNTYYLNARAVFTGTAPTAVGTIYAMQFGVN